MIKGIFSNYCMGLAYQNGIYYSTWAKSLKKNIQLVDFYHSSTCHFNSLGFSKIVICVPYAMVDAYVHYCPREIQPLHLHKRVVRQSSFYCGWKNGQEVWASIVIDEWKLQEYLLQFSHQMNNIHIIDIDVYVLWHLVYWYVVNFERKPSMIMALYQYSHGFYALFGRNDCLWQVQDVADLSGLLDGFECKPDLILSLNIDEIALKPYLSHSIKCCSLNLDKNYVLSTALALRGLYANL
jgi:hypothetical protein